MLFIMNPRAGIKRANWYLVDILTLYSRAGYAVTVHMTAGPGDGARAVAELAGGMDLVVCCGGDGTLNETISGLMAAGLEIPVGYIPAGSTNDFAASLALPTGILEAAKLAVEGVAMPCDIGSFGPDRYFSYVASFGAFTRASYSTPQGIKNALGHTAYLLEGIQELSQLRKEHVRLVADGETIEDDFLFGAICNTTSVGGLLNLDPNQVDMSDGLFELMLVRVPRDLKELSEAIRAFRTQKYNCAMVTFRPARQVQVFSPPGLIWTLDGERAEGGPAVTIENIHHGIRLVREETK